MDHRVPLARAHISGGDCWPRERKRAYVNDLGYDGALKASAAVVNCGKGAKAPDEWQPPDPAAWCTYAEMWVQVKAKRTLTVTTDEVDILEDMLETCPEGGEHGFDGHSCGHAICLHVACSVRTA